MFWVRPPLFLQWIFPQLCWRFNKKSRRIYLTFDDGPIPELTPQILGILEEKNVKASFFCVGENVKRYPSLFKELLDRGHQVGNHSFNHVQAYKISAKDYLDNVAEAKKIIPSRLFRPSHGQMTKRLEKALAQQYCVVMWDVLSGDYNSKFTPQRVIENVLKYTRNGSVIVFHDSVKAKKNVLSALPIIIDELRLKGFEFCRIED